MNMKCPVCECALEEDEAYDGWFSSDLYSEDVYGHCPICGRQYRWTNNYTYKETTDFKEVNIQ